MCDSDKSNPDSIHNYYRQDHFYTDNDLDDQTYYRLETKVKQGDIYGAIVSGF